MSATEEHPTAAPSPRVIAGRYLLGARRGASVDAALFEAYDPELQRPVVVKIMHPELSARLEVQAEFRGAMEAVASLHHPNIAVAHSWGQTEWNGHKVLYVVSEQLTGGSLRDMLDRGRMLSPSQALLVGLDACKALDVMHRRGIAHGDIRPSTLVFGEDRRMRVVDAGLSQVLDHAAGGPAHRPNDLAQYASPEQAKGAELQPKSDVYSLCLTMLETMTGQVPFAGDSTVSTLANRVDRLMPVSADLGALASVLERAGRPEPGDRYTAAEFGRALVAASERMPRPAPLPILANSLFGADTGGASEPVDPTGPLAAMPGARTVPLPPPLPLVIQSPSTAGVPVQVPPVQEPAPLAVTNTAKPADSATDVLDELDPADEFPDAPPSPGRTRKWFIALLLVMAAAGGALAWYTTRPDMRTVPDLSGMELGVALNAIAGDFTGLSTEEASETVEAGVVIRTDPAAGTEVEKDSAVTLVVSTGPAPRVLEDLTGLTVSEASAKLEAQGLVVALADAVNDEDIPVDSVVSWNVPASPTSTAGGTVVKGTTVQLVPSAGPALRSVPDLTGMTLDVATTAITDLRLVVAQAPDEFSSAIPAGAVLRQDPAPGTAVDRDSTVTVVLSKGPDLVTIPPVAGLDYAGVRAALEGAGFVVGAVQGNTVLPFIGMNVNGALAIPGMQFVRGTTVDLFYSFV
jgi:eukaryotic-like serine/threonine-protein kinase